MRGNLIKSLIIGSILGIVIGVSKIDSSNIGLMISLCSCIVLGLVTVMTIDNKPHLHTLPAIFVSSLFLCAFYGFKYGLVYTAGVAGIYGIFSVQLFQAIFIASDNVRYLVEKLFKNK
ncbi:MAG: putative membrane protein [Shewanella sp.]|jgi:hypothetical membrane protein